MGVLKGKSLYSITIDGVQVQVQLQYNLNTSHIGIYNNFHKSHVSSNASNVVVTHHIKYEEIHGCDETVLMLKGEHRKLHDRLRREGKCNISPYKLNRISKAAYSRGHKEEQVAYYQSHKEEKIAYHRQHVKNKSLHSYTPERYVQLQTVLQYHIKTGKVHIGTNRIYQPR